MIDSGKNRILVVIPARGGSKGIPRKNLRALNGKPLLFYSICTALKSQFEPVVYVSSEDEEILAAAKLFGAKTHLRDMSIASDHTTLDPVIWDCYLAAKEREDSDFDLIVTMQPTSPLLKSSSLDSAIKKILANSNIDTIISAKDSTHLTWKYDGGRFVPNYQERVNRQYLQPVYTETGGFLITKASCINKNSRLGNNIDLYQLKGSESIDIDSFEDWNTCEFFLRQKHILFVVTGNSNVGLGHVFNTLLLANDILNHRVTFLVDKESSLAFKKIHENNYTVLMQKNDDILSDILELQPDVVINDILDTSSGYILDLKKYGIKVVNFEDLGSGVVYADLVINAIYPEKDILSNHFFGHEYFLLRDEFIYSPQKEVKKGVERVLLTFGGVDPNNLTKKVLDCIYDIALERSIEIVVVCGFGYNKYESLEVFENIKIKRNASDISTQMLESDIIFTSAGRTIYEIASLGVPAIVLAQNKRELTHFFASSEFGFINLGLGKNISAEKIKMVFKSLLDSHPKREHMSNLMKKVDLKSGRKKVLQLIKKLMEN